MTKLELVLNSYFGYEGCSIDDMINIIDKDNGSREEMLKEVKYLLQYLNEEL